MWPRLLETTQTCLTEWVVEHTLIITSKQALAVIQTHYKGICLVTWIYTFHMCAFTSDSGEKKVLWTDHPVLKRHQVPCISRFSACQNINIAFSRASHELAFKTACACSTNNYCVWVWYIWYALHIILKIRFYTSLCPLYITLELDFGGHKLP